MNEIRQKFHGKEPNEDYFLGNDVKKSRLGCEGGKKIKITLRTCSGEHVLQWPNRAELP